jgi:hypothetical protein
MSAIESSQTKNPLAGIPADLDDLESRYAGARAERRLGGSLLWLHCELLQVVPRLQLAVETSSGRGDDGAALVVQAQAMKCRAEVNMAARVVIQ